MARGKRAPRISPTNGKLAHWREPSLSGGRLTGASWQSEYSLGRDIGEAARSAGQADLLPTVISVPGRTEHVDRAYVVHEVSPQVLDVDPDGWNMMPVDGPTGERKPSKVRIMPKRWYSRVRYVGQYVPQVEPVRHQKQYLGRGRAFHQGIAKALDGIDPELTGAQMSALISATRDECERLEIDWQKYVKKATDWLVVARALQKAGE